MALYRSVDDCPEPIDLTLVHHLHLDELKWAALQNLSQGVDVLLLCHPHCRVNVFFDLRIDPALNCHLSVALLGGTCLLLDSSRHEQSVLAEQALLVLLDKVMLVHNARQLPNLVVNGL